MDLRKVDDLYRDTVILDHCRNPRNSHELLDADLICDAVNSFCGDEIHIQINIDEYERIVEVGYQSDGCAINQATGSLISEHIMGLNLNEVRLFLSRFSNNMKNKDSSYSENESKWGDLEILYRVKEFPIRIKCVLLTVSALSSSLSSGE